MSAREAPSRRRARASVVRPYISSGKGKVRRVSRQKAFQPKRHEDTIHEARKKILRHNGRILDVLYDEESSEINAMQVIMSLEDYQDLLDDFKRTGPASDEFTIEDFRDELEGQVSFTIRFER